MFLADLHIHSAYSRATSKNSEPVALERTARAKGLQLIGSGDLTHPAYRALLKEKLIPAEDGLYRLKPELSAPLSGQLASAPPARFIVSGEISCIYKRAGRTRKVHNLILLPSLEAADRLSADLERIGNLHSDGRPILGLDSRDLLEITLNACPDAIFIPAHIWTPHFSLFGAYSGFDSIEECFADLTGEIHALETGLSSDPLMNFQLSALDKYTLVSNSDCHSPEKLAREANIFNCELSYPALRAALADREGDSFGGTIEFFPEEGKYHFDGHRNCHICTSPAETQAMGGFCPVCGEPLTAGVAGRVAQLADRPYGFRPPQARPYERLIPLPEVIAAAAGLASSGSVKVKRIYEELLNTLGPELPLLRNAALADIEAAAGAAVAEGIRRLRCGQVQWQPGYDGEYGRCTILSAADRDRLAGQMTLFGGFTAAAAAAAAADDASLPLAPLKTALPVSPAAERLTAQTAPDARPYGLSEEQWQAVSSPAAVTAVIAGPGSGKTRTLVSRIAHLLTQGVAPETVTAVTFTRKAAAELRERLSTQLADPALGKRLQVGTFHSLAIAQLHRSGCDLTLLDAEEAAILRREARAAAGAEEGERLYAQQLEQLQAVDFDGLLQKALSLSQQTEADLAFCTHLLVDEFQDADPLQYALIRAWHGAAPDRTLFVIGDPDQSIYGFRGADAACFEHLAADYPALHTVTLSRNYRSAARIVAASVPVISTDGQPRPLLPTRSEEGHVRLFEAESAFNEAVFIAHEIDALVGGVDMLSAHRKKGAKHQREAAADAPRALSDIAVLARTNRQLDLIEQCLIEQGVPCIVAGRGEFLSDPNVRDALACLRFLLDPTDLASLSRALRSFGSQSDEVVSARSSYQQIRRKSLAAWRKLAEDPKKQFSDAALFFTSWLTAAAPKARRSTPAALLDSYLQARLLESNPALTKLSEAAAAYDRLPEFLADACGNNDRDLQRSCGGYRQDAVLLTTLHGAKGLEFPVVFIAGLRNGLLPLPEAQGSDPAEERRLCYVGLTRAMEELYICGGEPVSPFLTAIPAPLLEKLGSARTRPPRSQQLSLF